MSTSYTNTLKLGQPAAGDTGWGDVVNSEVTAMIEEAIAGRVTINTWGVGSDPANTHILTSANGSTSETRPAILNLTDTTSDIAGGATGILIVPNNTKLYSVVNGTGHSVTVKTSSGSGITVTNNNSILLMIDGTNVVEAGRYLADAKMRTLETEHLATMNRYKLEATSTEIQRIQEEMRDAADHTAMMTELAIRNYVNATGSLRRSERIYPWANAGSGVYGTQPPSIAVAEDQTETVATFDLQGSASTILQELDLTITGTVQRSGTLTNPAAASCIIRVQRKSKGATGTSIGTVAVADAQIGGSNAHWYSISVSGDQTGKIDSFSYLDDAADGASKKKIQNATYDDGTNRTTIVYDNVASSAGLFSGTGGTVYVSSSGFESVGTWVTAIPYVPDSSTEGLNETFSISENLPVDASGTAQSTKRSVTLPKLKLVPDSGGAGDIEMRVQVGAGLSSAKGQYTFYVLQVDQTDITRT